MLWNMCKECAKADRDYYHERRRTGEVIQRTKDTGGHTMKIVQCTVCGHVWHYFSRRRK